MDINSLDLSVGAEKGFDLVVKNPLTGKETDIVINILGSDSKTYRKSRTEAVRESARNPGLDADDISAMMYASCVTGWSNVFDGDKELAFSYETAVALFKRLSWLMDQVGVAVDTRSNFTKPTETT